jgi:flavin reductase (DIM6/NTAB) family NADH-FMN oxidoreductase RutF
MLLVCIDYECSVLPLFRANPHYGICILGDEQQDLSIRFAQRGRDRFDGVDWVPGETGVPLIPSALAHFECEVHQTVEAGDHAVFIAEVVRALFREGKPLLYFGSGYHSLAF